MGSLGGDFLLLEYVFFFLVEVLVHGSVAGILWCPGAFSGAVLFFSSFLQCARCCCLAT